MKKIFLLMTLVIFCSSFLSAQNPPENLDATKNGNNVTLNWVAPTTGIELLNEGFETTSWPPANWQIKKSVFSDSLTLITPSTSTWIHCSPASFDGSGAEYIHSGAYSAAIGYNCPDWNWLITPQINITSAAMMRFWVWYTNDASYTTKFKIAVLHNNVWTDILRYQQGTPSNVFYAPVNVSLNQFVGQTVKIAFIFMYNDGYEMGLDDITVSQNSMKLSQPDLSKFTKINAPRRALSAYDIENNSIRENTRMTLENYKVYRNGTTIATLPANTTTYNDYNLAVGTYNYYVTAVYDSAESDPSNTETVDISAAIIILSESFESGNFNMGTLANWVRINADGDGYQWEIAPSDIDAHTGNKCVWTQSYANGVGPLFPDNYLISSLISIPARPDSTRMSFWVAAVDPEWPSEHYVVKISNGGTTVADFTQTIYNSTLTDGLWHRVDLDLTQYAGTSIRVAWEHNQVSDQYAMRLDDVEFYYYPGNSNYSPDASASLYQNYPNPFNPSTTISFNLRQPSKVDLAVYNIKGEKVVTLARDLMASGNHNINWNGKDLNNKSVSSGVYFYKLTIGQNTQTRKMILMK